MDRNAFDIIKTIERITEEYNRREGVISADEVCFGQVFPEMHNQNKMWYDREKQIAQLNAVADRLEKIFDRLKRKLKHNA
jgi:hypothetical protein